MPLTEQGLRSPAVAIVMLASLLLLPVCGQSVARGRQVPAPGYTAASIDGGGGSGAPRRATVVRPSPPVPTDSFDVINSWPHDPAAFTQGLIYYHGRLYESTGLYGASSLREVELETGAVLRKVAVPEQYFAEGLTIFGDRIVQLTWQSQQGFIYDLPSFRLQGEFSYTGEGWGLTHDGHYLIMSDGTHQLRFLDPTSFAVVKAVGVYYDGRPVTNLNELEYVRGEIYANIWQTDRIARIDPQSGRILGWIDLTGLLPAADRSASVDVLNGIAYDAATDRLFVTGKRWPKLFEIRLKRVARPAVGLGGWPLLGGG